MEVAGTACWGVTQEITAPLVAMAVVVAPHTGEAEAVVATLVEVDVRTALVALEEAAATFTPAVQL